MPCPPTQRITQKIKIFFLYYFIYSKIKEIIIQLLSKLFYDSKGINVKKLGFSSIKEDTFLRKDE